MYMGLLVRYKRPFLSSFEVLLKTKIKTGSDKFCDNLLGSYWDIDTHVHPCKFVFSPAKDSFCNASCNSLQLPWQGNDGITFKQFRLQRLGLIRFANEPCFWWLQWSPHGLLIKWGAKVEKRIINWIIFFACLRMSCISGVKYVYPFNSVLSVKAPNANIRPQLQTLT